MTQLSRAERRNVVEGFFEQVSDGINVDKKWVRQMVEATIPELPDEPTPEQCDAWIELSSILADPAFIANMRSNASDVWGRDSFDLEASQKASDAIVRRAKQAIEAGIEPISPQGRELARNWLETSARLMNREPDAAFRGWLREKYAHHDPRASRYWELVAIMRGHSPDVSPNREWTWILAAMRHHLAD